jgi:acylphosphatase
MHRALLFAIVIRIPTLVVRNPPSCVKPAYFVIHFPRDESGMMSIQVFYEGNVQGVGFRWSVRHIAKGFDVSGWVRNLIDGRVEMQVSGEADEVRAFLDAIMQSELRAHIRKQTENKLDKPVTAHGFEIRHD